jgi:lipid-A-disaccharide synthase
VNAKLYLVAAEESGDALGGALMAALRTLDPGATVAGVGGRAMTAQGIASPFSTDDLSIIGFASIPQKLPLILRRIRETADAVIAARPDALIIIDSPDFTHRVARRVRKAAPAIAIINYAPPTVWAWRPWRARAMRVYVDEVLAVLPFEPVAFARLNGPHCTYVGHPLAERIADLRPNAAEAARRQSDPPTLLVLPGSRRSEINRLGATSCCQPCRTSTRKCAPRPPIGRCARASSSTLPRSMPRSAQRAPRSRPPAR